MLIWLILLPVTQIAAKNPVASSSQSFVPLFNTKTAYESVHGTITVPPSTCKPLQIWMLIRHGTRYPKEKHLNEFIKLQQLQAQIVQNHKQGVGQLDIKALQKVSKWKINTNVNAKMAGILTPNAETVVRNLAKRVRSAYPDLLNVKPATIKPHDYIFRSTKTQRTQYTLQFFLTTLFGNSGVVTPIQPDEQDLLLTPAKYLPQWKNGLEASNSKNEKQIFQTGPEIHSVVCAVSTRLGFSQLLDLNAIEMMYKMCGYETSWEPNKMSAWCSVFTMDELKIFEFYQDLGAYYRIGPGRSLSATLGCTLLKNLIDSFKRIEQGINNQPKGIFYFGHSSSIQMLLSTLGIGKEPAPRASSYNTAESRTYRTSLLVPFTSNILATFYRCSGKTMQHKVMFHVAEKLIPFPGCPEGFCDFSKFQSNYKKLMDQCCN